MRGLLVTVGQRGWEEGLKDAGGDEAASLAMTVNRRTLTGFSPVRFLTK